MEKEYIFFHLDSKQSVTDIESTEDEKINAKMVSDQYRVTPETEASNYKLQIVLQIESAMLFVTTSKKKKRADIEKVLSSPWSVPYAQQVASCYKEGKIGEEMVKHSKKFKMLDGTSRSKVGKIGGCVVHIAG